MSALDDVERQAAVDPGRLGGDAGTDPEHADGAAPRRRRWRGRRRPWSSRRRLLGARGSVAAQAIARVPRPTDSPRARTPRTSGTRRSPLERRRAGRGWWSRWCRRAGAPRRPSGTPRRIITPSMRACPPIGLRSGPRCHSPRSSLSVAQAVTERVGCCRSDTTQSGGTGASLASVLDGFGVQRGARPRPARRPRSPRAGAWRCRPP